MATNSSNPSLLPNTRNASKIDIDATLQNLPRYKAIVLLENSFQESLQTLGKSLDITSLLHLLKIIKNHPRISPSTMILKKPVHVDGTNFSLNMKISFLNQCSQIKVFIHVIYTNREHILTANNHPSTKEEIVYSKLIKTIEKTYTKL